MELPSANQLASDNSFPCATHRSVLDTASAEKFPRICVCWPYRGSDLGKHPSFVGNYC